MACLYDEEGACIPTTPNFGMTIANRLCERRLPAGTGPRSASSTAASLFADAVYEVTSVLDGRLVDFDGHRAHLHRSLGELEMGLPVSDAELGRSTAS